MAIAELFSSYRPYLFTVAYRMLGAVEEAEDAVQDAYLKVRHLQPESIRNPKSYLTRVVTHLCLDRLKALKRARQDYPGPWLPEPLELDKEQQVHHRESLSTAYLLLLEELGPVERAVFLLREAFDHPYEDIAFILNKSVDNCRQIYSRSRKHLKNCRKIRSQPDNEKAVELINQLIDYAEKGEYEALTRLFVKEATVVADGGGKARGALRHILYGAENAGKFVLGAAHKLNPDGAVFIYKEYNDAPALVGLIDNQPFLVLSIAHDGAQITALYALANPDKLIHIMNKPDPNRDKIKITNSD
ncbi:sigma-70 family RNA polymerase sigma factor [Flavilitoribacter nigricans]|uniref:RNA polymerase sigma-70 factor n=1 Tax=Flavilitoribacter nigricans (strain ATCC 23147 / DSM 23189 / NBRC 102662 / NCIMB 1420 / SS-2) TaxID=1122177 RepID=A0A2D0NI80_FLAN2|nr:sigma-70 family RNA polymerase sigma factor [Flavilitoribacter nigricans]PHN08090.1 hypothetical protein CRP01_03480 [Flavilitoribacter nigricans DSM 23189 = NBRC 102662]